MCSAPGGALLPPSELLHKGLLLAFYANMGQWQFGAVSLGVPLAVYVLLMTIKAVFTGRDSRRHVTFAGR
jgi:hypothetical protein